MTTTTDAIDLAIQRQALDIELELYFRKQRPVPFQDRKALDARTKPAPVTNPNAAAYDQVHAFPKGLW
jgi:hypothetical protein